MQKLTAPSPDTQIHFEKIHLYVNQNILFHLIIIIEHKKYISSLGTLLNTICKSITQRYKMDK